MAVRLPFKVAALLLLTAGPMLSIGAAHAASASPPACAGQDPYKASAQRLAECGVASYGVQSRTRLADGGFDIRYATSSTNEGAVGTLVPPAGFDASRAPASELALYGIPAEPPLSNVASHTLWMQMVHNMHFVAPAAVLHNAPGLRFGQIGTVNQSIWAGFYTSEGTGYFHYAQATFIEPPKLSSRCDPNDAAGFWTGIGGVGNSNIGQQGTAIGVVDNLGQNQGWFETNLGTVYAASVYATVNYNFYVSTSYTNGQYQYFFYNYYNGASGTWYTGSSSYSGATTDYIAERPTSNLANFGTVQFTNVTAASQQYPIGNYPDVKVIMVNPADNYTLATPSGLNSAGDAFSVTQNSCN